MLSVPSKTRCLAHCFRAPSHQGHIPVAAAQQVLIQVREG